MRWLAVVASVIVALTVPAVTEATVTGCTVTQNRTTNPDRATAHCSGSGRFGFHIRCKFYDNGPYLHRWTTLTAPTTYTLPCTSTYPIIYAAWVDTSYPY